MKNYVDASEIAQLNYTLITLKIVNRQRMPAMFPVKHESNRGADFREEPGGSVLLLVKLFFFFFDILICYQKLLDLSAPFFNIFGTFFGM